jgi:hypothetical protein
MNVFCRLFGHTWWPETRVPEVRWNTTKEGHTLEPTIEGMAVRHVVTCKRCGEERVEEGRRHDGDRPVVAEAGKRETEGEEGEE